MLFHAEILAHDTDGTMERILRVLRHRGYGTRRLYAQADPEQQLLHIKIEGESERSLGQLALQMEKLCDVIEVSVGELPMRMPKFEARAVTPVIRRPVYASSSRG